MTHPSIKVESEKMESSTSLKKDFILQACSLYLDHNHLARHSGVQQCTAILVKSQQIPGSQEKQVALEQALKNFLEKEARWLKMVFEGIKCQRHFCGISEFDCLQDRSKSLFRAYTL